MTFENTGRGWTEDEIAAFVDGSLDADRAAEIRAILDADPDAKALADEIEASNALLRDAFGDIAEAPVPARLEAAVLGAPGKVAEFPAKRRGPSAVSVFTHAVAASVCLAIGLAGGSYLNDRPGGAGVAAGALAGDSPLHAALDSLPSGTALRDTYVPMLSFRDAAGRYCREFEVRVTDPRQMQLGLACRATDRADWRIEIVVAAPDAVPEITGYSLASGPGGDALNAMLDALGAGPVLPPDEEATLIEQGWPTAD
ncbi:MAG: hypothetical protein AAFV19_15010 [Pseudomonadota bacterium]